MKINFKLKFNKRRYKANIYRMKCAAVVITTVVFCVLLLIKSNTYINISIIGDNSNDNSINNENLETTAVTLFTDETTAISNN